MITILSGMAHDASSDAGDALVRNPMQRILFGDGSLCTIFLFHSVLLFTRSGRMWQVISTCPACLIKWLTPCTSVSGRRHPKAPGVGLALS